MESTTTGAWRLGTDHQSRRPSAFQFFGCVGLVLSVSLAIHLVISQRLSLIVLLLMVLTAVGTFFLLATTTKIITGDDRLIYYHHEIAIALLTTMLVLLLRQPVLPYLDVAILSIGMFLSFGRIGCLMVGCCHGRPSTSGVMYGPQHVIATLSPHFVGVRLFPVQALESLGAMGIVVIGIIFINEGRPPGDALAFYVITYGVGRSLLEFLRGDTGRGHCLDCSEAQWTSCALMCGVLWAELHGRLGFYLWHFSAVVFLVALMFFIAVRRRVQDLSAYLLWSPHRLREFTEAVQLVSRLAVTQSELCKPNGHPLNIHVGCTSFGIRLSATRIARAVEYIYHYSISYEDGVMSEKAARSLTKLILKIKHPSGSGEVVKGSQGVFHLLVRSAI